MPMEVSETRRSQFDKRNARGEGFKDRKRNIKKILRSELSASVSVAGCRPTDWTVRYAHNSFDFRQSRICLHKCLHLMERTPNLPEIDPSVCRVTPSRFNAHHAHEHRHLKNSADQFCSRRRWSLNSYERSIGFTYTNQRLGMNIKRSFRT